MRLLASLVVALALPGFTPVDAGPNGGILLTGVFPDKAAPPPLRKGFVYLPPGFSYAKRYPVVYLLHGMPGDPDEYVNALGIQDLGDKLISKGVVRPFIARRAGRRARRPLQRRVGRPVGGLPRPGRRAMG